jgi:protein-S-isoprenylcysteine O-methyltransferase Ste14
MIWRRVRLIGLGWGAALAMAWLGLFTARENILGWCVVGVGLGCCGGGAVYLAVTQFDPGRPPAKGDRSLWLLTPGLAAVFFGAPLEWLLLPSLLPRGLIDQALGLGLIVAGLVLWAWTWLAQGRDGQTHRLARRSQHMTYRGPYQFVRHPGYTGLVLLALGIAQGFSSVIALAAVPLLLLPAIGNRICGEEEQRLAAVGREYREYQRRTKRLLPGLW